MKNTTRFLFIIFLFFYTGCIQRFSKEEILMQKETLKSKILEKVNKSVNIYILPFENNSKDKEIDYLSTAIQNSLYEFLYFLEYENAYIPFEVNSTPLTKDIEDIVIKKDSYFYKYATNFNTRLTQYSISYSNYVTTEIITTSNKIETQKGKKKIVQWKQENITNYITNTITNYSVSNIVNTNIATLPKENFLYILSNEIPDLTNEASYLKINVSNIESSSNLTLLSNIIYYTIGGSYKVEEKKKTGTKIINIEIILSNFVLSTSSSNLNIKKFNISAREDSIQENLWGFIKEVRKMVLNKPVGDIIVTSNPEDVSVYVDGIFIGKTPLYFPSIVAKKHRFTFSKQEYHNLVVEGEIKPNITNYIFKDLKKKSVGGILKITSNPSNSKVFLESQYVGNTPLVISNLPLQMQQRIIIHPRETNFVPSYYTIILNNTNEIVEIDSRLNKTLGYPEYVKKLMWGLDFLSWGITTSILGLSIYSHYLGEYFKDRYFSLQKEYDRINYSYYENMSKTYLNFFVISGVISTGLTAFALQTEEINLGFNIERNLFFASISLKY